MIVAFLIFGFALVQVLLDEGIISLRKRVLFAIVTVAISVIPLVLQSVIVLGELARAGRYSPKLLMHRMLINIMGSYGPSSTLLLKQYRQKKIGEYDEATGTLWSCCLYFLHSIIMPCRGLSFGDAFSGLFAVRHVSVALWMENNREPWLHCIKPNVGDDLFSKPHVKSVRDLTLTVVFSPADEQSTDVDCHVSATGSRESLISKLYLEKWNERCSKEDALEFCMLIETLNNDSFVVKSRPPEGNDHILPCEELDVIVESILKHRRKLNARRVFGMSYV